MKIEASRFRDESARQRAQTIHFPLAPRATLELGPQLGLGALLTLLFCPDVAQAGQWGSESWGALIWGVGGPAPLVPGLDVIGISFLTVVLILTGLPLIRKHKGIVVRAVIVFIAFAPLAAYATQISVPFSFANGATADANEVNANFDTLIIESNAQDTRLSSVESTVAAIPDITLHISDPSAHHLKTTLFSELSDSIADAQIPLTLTRDSEVFGITLASDGAGSGLDADLLDGLNSAAFATDGEVFPLVLVSDGPGSGLNADRLDGLSNQSFLRSNVNDNYTAGTMTFNQSTTLNLNGTVSIGANSGANDDSLYFDQTSERLYWGNSETRFRFTDALALEGPLGVGNATSGSFSFNYLQLGGNPAPRGPAMGNSGDLYVQFDLEIGSNLYLDRMLFMNATTTTGAEADQIIFFYEDGSTTGEYFRWDDSDDHFEFSDNAAFALPILVGHVDGTYSYSRFATDSTQVPASGLMNSKHDLYVGDDIETAGDIYVDGFHISTPRVTIRSGADLSEGFEISDISSGGDAGIEPGTVVCIDSANPGALKTCTEAYDRTVAGIISGAGGIQTGLMMGQEGSIASGSHPVALTGRVYVKARVDNAPIRPGDLITTSGTHGYAMRVDDFGRSAGAVLGKAMTSLEEKEGLVLVLVSLQ